MTITIYENEEVVDSYEGTKEECLAYFDEHYGNGDFEYQLD